MQPINKIKVQELIEKKLLNLEFEIKNNDNPDMITGEIIGYLEAFLMLSLITTFEFSQYHRRFNKIQQTIQHN